MKLTSKRIHRLSISREINRLDITIHFQVSNPLLCVLGEERHVSVATWKDEDLVVWRRVEFLIVVLIAACIMLVSEI
jgi:hypothetical protein